MLSGKKCLYSRQGNVCLCCVRVWMNQIACVRIQKCVRHWRWLFSLKRIRNSEAAMSMRVAKQLSLPRNIWDISPIPIKMLIDYYKNQILGIWFIFHILITPNSLSPHDSEWKTMSASIWVESFKYMFFLNIMLSTFPMQNLHSFPSAKAPQQTCIALFIPCCCY